jgi:hypothetical protein
VAVYAYCLVCDRLVPVTQGQYKGEGRERWFYPYDHDDQSGNRCPGAKRGI